MSAQSTRFAASLPLCGGASCYGPGCRRPATARRCWARRCCCSRWRRRRPGRRRSGPSSRRACWARPRWSSLAWRPLAAGARAAQGSDGGPPRGRAAAGDGQRSAVRRRAGRAARARSARGRRVRAPGAGVPGLRRGARGAVDARQLVPLRPAARALAAALRRVRGAGRGRVALSPTIARGLRTLIHRPSLFEGAAMSTVPLVGDVRITYSYPGVHGPAAAHRRGIDRRHRRREGDARAHRDAPAAQRRAGRCCCWARPARRARSRRQLSDNTLVAELTLTEDAQLPVLAAAAVRPRRARGAQPSHDRRGRRRAAGRDPGPGRPAGAGDAAADRDRVLGQRRLRRSAPSSWSTAPAIAPSSASLLRDGGGARTVQGRTLWDPASAGLGGAERIAYRIEARDRDDVSGGPQIGKPGTSRTLYVIIQNPHESLEDRLERQRELLEKLIGDLAQRLERGAERRRRRRRALAAAMSRDARRRGVAPGAAGPADRRGSAQRHAGQGAARGARRHRRSPGAAAARGGAGAGGAQGQGDGGRPGAAGRDVRAATSPSWRTTCCCWTI